MNNFSSNIEITKKAQKEFKKRFWKKKRKLKDFSLDTSAVGSNMTSNNLGPKGLKKDFSRIIYYNCNKKGDYIWIYIEPKKMTFKKLVAVLATSVLMTGAGKEVVLQYIACICYLI